MPALFVFLQGSLFGESKIAETLLWAATIGLGLWLVVSLIHKMVFPHASTSDSNRDEPSGLAIFSQKEPVPHHEPVESALATEEAGPRNAPTPQFPPSSLSAPPPRPGTVTDPVQLKMRRSQRPGYFGKIIFALDARIEPNAEQLALIRKYKLGNKVVYESAARTHHKEALAEHSNALSNTPIVGGFADTAGALFRTARAATRAAAMALSLRCTVDSLIAGQHIECKDLAELLEAEDAVHSACENVKSYLITASSFDGSEQLHEI